MSTIQTLDVALGERAYPILIGPGAWQELPRVLNDVGSFATVGLVTDSNVGPLYRENIEALIRAAGLTVVTHILPAGEEHKRLTNIEAICGTFLAGGLDRSSVIVALGGGVTGDMAGFAAASFMRGIPFIQLPTTIVAQVDSSVGGKTGVNHPLGKNTIGAFHQPLAVITDMNALKTLPERELCAGLAEALKHGIIADAELFDYMEQHVDAILAKNLDALVRPVYDSCVIKASVVAQDEKEHGLRAILNYGHTFGHGVETVTAYTKFLHGEALGLGMHAAAVLGRELGLVDDGFVARQRACLEAYGLPVCWPEAPVEAILEAMTHDKKVRAGKMKFIVPTKFGHVDQRTDVSSDSARRAVEAMKGES